jgi:CRISPR/Cas system-associated endoribonuclease Cas2
LLLPPLVRQEDGKQVEPTRIRISDRLWNSIFEGELKSNRIYGIYKSGKKIKKNNQEKAHQPTLTEFWQKKQFF